MKRFIIRPLMVLLLPFMFFACEQNAEVSPTTVASSRAEPIVKCPTPTITLSPCDMGFTFYASWLGSPWTDTMPYTIRTMGGTVVDSGNIVNGTNTNQVLSPCTTYEITVWSWCAGNIVLYKVSDGCGGVYLC